MTIRKATLEDAVILSHLFNLYRVFYHKTSDKDAAFNFISERIKSNDSEILIAENTDRITVGFIQLYPLFSSTQMQKLWLLNDLYVSELYRGQGISKLLIEAAKKIAVNSNACGIMLETAKNNTIGNKLYTLTGFELENESNFYFWTNHPNAN